MDKSPHVPKVAVLGSINRDYVMALSGALPQPGETVGGARFAEVSGGKGANQAVAAARAGAGVALLGCVGNDAAGGAMVEAFAADGIDTTGIATVAGEATGAAVILVDGKGENVIAVAPGANGAVTAERVDAWASVIGGCDWLLLQLEVPVPAVERALDLAKARGVKTVLNYAPVSERAVRLDGRVDGLVVNEHEAGALLGQTAPAGAEAAEDAARRLLEGGHAFVVITLGADGAMAVERDGRVTHVPAFRIEVVDTVAAGDTFCGALVTRLGEGKDLASAMRFAAAGSALCVSRAGAQPSIPWRKDIEGVLKE